MNIYKGYYHSSKKQKELKTMDEKEINKKYKTAVANDIIFITLVALACFTIGITIGITIG